MIHLLNKEAILGYYCLSGRIK